MGAAGASTMVFNPNTVDIRLYTSGGWTETDCVSPKTPSRNVLKSILCELALRLVCYVLSAHKLKITRNITAIVDWSTFTSVSEL